MAKTKINCDGVAEKKRTWKESNKCLIASYSANYRARKLRAIPIWARNQTARDRISELYNQARLTGEITGIPHSADHIVPLKSNVVCGLNCPDNLRILTFSENSSKSNRYWPNMP